MVEVRNGTTDDINFIYATMLRGLYHGCELYGLIEKEAFYSNYEQVLAKLLLKPVLELKIACLTLEPEVILGYALAEPGVLHFVYIKSPFRGQNIAKQLLASCSEIRFVTHLTKSGNAIRLKKGWVYNPFLL